jgi:hypothetical protein
VPAWQSVLSLIITADKIACDLGFLRVVPIRATEGNMGDHGSRRKALKADVSAPIEISTISEIVFALHAIKELDGLSLHEFLWLANHGRELKLTDGTLIFGEGTPPEHLI